MKTIYSLKIETTLLRPTPKDLTKHVKDLPTCSLFKHRYGKIQNIYTQKFISKFNFDF